MRNFEKNASERLMVLYHMELWAENGFHPVEKNNPELLMIKNRL